VRAGAPAAAPRHVQREHTARFDSIDRELDSIDQELREHRGRFDSIEAGLRSLTQLVGQVLDRLPPGERN
jgi:septal ring factor EnvC (AmiA/AmiB activator)